MTRGLIESVLLFCAILRISSANIFSIEHPPLRTPDDSRDEAFRSHKRIPFLSMFPDNRPHVNLDEQDVGKPLILTPLLKAGKFKEAQKAATVDNISNFTSYSGFFTVNEEFNSNLFFWFFPAAYKPEKAPVILWLQGGPGGSSLFGLFVENGPFSVDKDLNLNLRDTAWSLPFNLIYIDQPAGTGFSFTDNEKGYAENQDDVARDLYEALKQFYQTFPSLKENDLYITGESYAGLPLFSVDVFNSGSTHNSHPGKYVPAISHKIFKENEKKESSKIPLKGLAIGDGLTDPIDQMDYGDFLFQTGLLDEKDRDFVKIIAEQAKANIKAGNWKRASDLFGEVMDYFADKTKLNFYYNYLLSNQPEDFNYYNDFLQKPEVRKNIHVGNLPYDGISMVVHQHLYEDMPKSVRPLVEELLDNDFKVMIYSGQLDIIVAYPLTENYISSLNWHGAEDYTNATRLVWKVDGDVAGFVREVGKFRQVMVRNAGHILPYDQPKWAFDMISRFVLGKSFG